MTVLFTLLSNIDQLFGNVSFYLFIITAVISIYLIFKAVTTTKGKIYHEPIYMPIEGVNAAEIGMIKDDSADKEDLASLIIEFANEGYIAIEDCKESTMGLRIKLKRIKRLPTDAPSYKQYLMRTLFEAQGSEEVKLYSLKYTERYYDAISDLQVMFSGDKSLTDSKKHAKHLIAMFIMGLLTILTNFNYPLFSDGWGDFAIGAIACYITVMLLGLGLSSKVSDNVANSKSKKIKLSILIYIGVVFMGFLFTVFNEEITNVELTISTYIVTALVIVLMPRLAADTEYRKKYLGKVLGMKEFMETAEKKRLTELVNNDPMYFYKMLPYAISLNIAKVWADKFKDIPMCQPEWLITDPESQYNHCEFIANFCYAYKSGFEKANNRRMAGFNGISTTDC